MIYAALLNFLFSICTVMHFGSLFFLNERNMTTSLLMIHLKCTVVHYTNLNWSSKNKPFLNYGSLNMLFCFFRILTNIVTGAEQFLATESPWKIMKSTFYFTNTNWMLLANQILHILRIFIKPNVWYSWSLKILAIKY